ncbi:MAG: hypothetical protein ACLSWS_13575, partial [Faecalispora jeddahensis]
AAFRKHRANESALKMPADRRNRKARFQMKLGEWAFSLERLFSSFLWRYWYCSTKRIPKVSLGESLPTFFS